MAAAAVTETRVAHNVPCRTSLGVAALLLDGEIKFRAGVLESRAALASWRGGGGGGGAAGAVAGWAAGWAEVEAGLGSLREAVAADQGLPYDEVRGALPQGWGQIEARIWLGVSRPFPTAGIGGFNGKLRGFVYGTSR